MDLLLQFDNITSRVIDDLKVTLKKGSKVSIAAASFSIYAFEALQKELEQVEELQFIFTSPTFNKERAKKQKRYSELLQKAVASIVELKKRIAVKEIELKATEAKMRKEPQFDIQMEMNKKVKTLRKELADLKKEVEDLK